METTLLKTKLYVPPVRREIVSRPRLTERLNAGVWQRDGAAQNPGFGRKLTMVSAPAGFGKSTLVSDWLSGVEPSLAWLSLDEGDNDLARFLSYVIIALQQIDADLGQTTYTLLQSSPAPVVEPLVTALINEIAVLDNPFVFVLDDYHVISLGTIHKAVTFLLEHMPPLMHLVIVTREDPPLSSLARLRVQQQMTELRANDLRFTEDEVTAFFGQTMGLNLSAEAVKALENRTEGWIAGLQMAALSMQGEPAERIPGFIQTFTGSHHYVVDYLAEEVLKRRPAGTRSFLLRTSILDRLTGSLCNALTGDEDGQATLAQLERANLFLIPLDNERRWYRYHHLFAELLRNQLAVSQPDLVPDLHLQASAWYEHNNLLSEAIAHSLAAKDFKRAAELTEQTFIDRMSRGEYFSTMLDRLEALPDEIIRARPSLGVMLAWMLSITLQPDAVEPRLRDVEESAGDELPADLRRQITLVRAELARHNKDFAESIEHSLQLLEALPEELSNTDRQTFTGAVFNLSWAYYRRGDPNQARDWFSEALAIGKAAGSLTLTLTSIMGTGLIQTLLGQLRQAADTYRQGLQMADEFAQQTGQAVPAAAYCHLALGDVLREWNELDDAARHLAQGVELGRRWRIDGFVLRAGYLVQARLKQAQGDTAGALHAVREAEQLAQAYRGVRGFGNPIAACRTQLTLAQAASTGRPLAPRELELVSQWAEGRGFSAEGIIESGDDEQEHLVWVRLLIAKHEPDRALQVLARLYLAAEDAGRAGSVIEILALRALSQQMRGETEQALVSLERALTLTEPEGYVRLFVDEGAPMAELLRQAVSRGVELDYVGRLLAAFGKVAPEPRESSSHEREGFPVPLVAQTAPPRDTIEPLTDREMEVLRLLSTDLSGPDIAKELFVSRNTVKTHVKRIYDKLDAHSRYEAVERARELGLF
jgi:LuxR family maltose regulon positive regulatory protein